MSREVFQYFDKDGNPVTAEAAHEEGGRTLRDGFILRRRMMLMDGEGDEVATVLDALRSDDADKLDWARLEANRLASRERSRGNPRAAMALEQARDDAAARLRNRVPEKGSSDEAYATYRSRIGNAWKGGDAA